MHQHWDKYLNVRSLMRKHKPKFVVELGAGSGNNTSQIVELQNEFPFEMTVINDGHTPEADWLDKVTWINGISYIELPKLQRWIDFCSIDTDHNYWTLMRELVTLQRHMPKSGIVVMHDTETYGKVSGHFFKYVTDYEYPLPMIESYEKEGKTMSDAIEQIVDLGYFRIIKKSKKSQGAIAMERI